MTSTILISGGAGYIGSHAAYALRQAGHVPVIADNLSTGHSWAAASGILEQGNIGDGVFIRSLCEKYRFAAALHFAAFIEVGESVQNPAKYFDNNRDRAIRFFDTLKSCGVDKIVFSSTAAVYGDAGGSAPLLETQPAKPITPYGQSKLEAELYLRSLDRDGVRSVCLRYFNVAGAAPGAGIGEAHRPETHLLPRLILPLLATPLPILQRLNLHNGFTIYGTDYPTPDGTAIRDYIHVMDLIEAHLQALAYLKKGGPTSLFNLGNGRGYSVNEIVQAARQALNRPDFAPATGPRRPGDPPILIASYEKARQILGWHPKRDLVGILEDAIAWHRSEPYRQAIKASD